MMILEVPGEGPGPRKITILTERRQIIKILIKSGVHLMNRGEPKRGSKYRNADLVNDHLNNFVMLRLWWMDSCGRVNTLLPIQVFFSSLLWLFRTQYIIAWMDRLRNYVFYTQYIERCQSIGIKQLSNW